MVSVFASHSTDVAMWLVQSPFRWHHNTLSESVYQRLDSIQTERVAGSNTAGSSRSLCVVVRIMSVGPRPFPQGRRNEDGSDPRATMTYEDYVYFMLSEEDRGNEHSLRYWFTCVDLDGDGRIGHMEMRLFYESQVSYTRFHGATSSDRNKRVDGTAQCCGIKGV